jgi:hypothetical protein
MSERDSVVLKKIIQYADEITFTKQKLVLDYETFSVDIIAKRVLKHNRRPTA